MQSISQFALAASIFASVMGALVMCVLVFRYGFTVPSPSDAEVGPTPSDVLITRVGHAVAGVCFAATAVLAIVALSVRTPERNATSAPAVAAPTPVEVVAAAEPASEGRAARVEGEVGALDALEVRLAEAEAQLARLDGEIRSKSAPTDAIEPKRPVARREAPAPSRPLAVAAPTPVLASASRPVASEPAAMPLEPPVARPAASAPAPLPLEPPVVRQPVRAPVVPDEPIVASSAPAPPRAVVPERKPDPLATVREEWNTNRQRAAAWFEDIRAAMTRAELTMSRHLGPDPQGRVSARD